jgi:hypothetical protein
VFISKEHSNAITPVWTPGAGHYQQPPSVGPQAYSERKSAAAFGFGTDSRFSEQLRQLRISKAVPAPGEYKLVNSVGTQSLSVKPTAGRPVFPMASRDNKICYKGFEEAFYAKVREGWGGSERATCAH